VYILPLHRNGGSSIVACVFISAGTCLPNRCLAMNFFSVSAIPDFRRHVAIQETQNQTGLLVFFFFSDFAYCIATILNEYTIGYRPTQ
jgi:hypothetical protein